MSATTQFALLPRDGFFCKDGRGWHTSASGRGHSVDWPWPSTILGAVRTAWGRKLEETNARTFQAADWLKVKEEVHLSRTLVLRRPFGEPLDPDQPFDRDHRMWVVPADALYLEREGRAEVQALAPREPSGGGLRTLGREEADEEAREALWVPHVDDKDKPLPRPRWWREVDFVDWLCGNAVSAEFDTKELRRRLRVQAHVGIRPDTFTADEGVLFSHDVVETLEKDHDGTRAEWAVGIEALVPNDGASPSAMLAAPVTLGADQRLADIVRLSGHIFEPPDALIAAFASQRPTGLRLVLVGATEFKAGWRPDRFTVEGREFVGHLPGLEGELVLRAAFVGRPVHISGWDMAASNGRGQPKPTSRMAAPGTVYFFERRDGKPFSESDAHPLWLAALGGRTNEGFGRVVPGIWNPQRRST